MLQLEERGCIGGYKEEAALPWPCGCEFSKCGAEQDLFHRHCAKPDGFYFLLALPGLENQQLFCSLLSVELHL